MEDLKLEWEKLDCAMVYLLGAFTWENSKEGHKFWSDVYDKLAYYRDLAKDESNV